MKPLTATPETYSNDLTIEQAPTGKTKCKQCGERVVLGDIRVSFKRYWSKSYYFHLDCFTPITHVRVNTAGCAIKLESHWEKVEKWAENWNKQFDFDEKCVEIAGKRRVLTGSTVQKRVLMEIFKFLEVKTIVSVVVFVSKGWYSASWEDELWISLQNQSFPRQIQSKTDYFTVFFSSCVHCGHFLTQKNRHMVCPLTKRPKCVVCYSNILFRPQFLPWVERSNGIKPKLLRFLGVKTFIFDGKECVYLYQALPKVKKHRKKLAEEVLNRKNEDYFRLVNGAFWEEVEKWQEDDFLDLNLQEYKLPNECRGGIHREILSFIAAGDPISTLPKKLTKFS